MESIRRRRDRGLVTGLLGLALLLLSCSEEAHNTTSPQRDLGTFVVLGGAVGWCEESHGKGADPNYELVFDANEVQRIDLEVSPESWRTMLHDLTELLGAFGAPVGQGGPEGGDPGEGGRGPGRGISPEMTEACDTKAAGDQCSLDNGQGTCTTVKGMLVCVVEEAGDDEPCAGLAEGALCTSGAGGPQDGTCELSGDALRCVAVGAMRPALRNPIWVPCTVHFEGRSWAHVGLRFKGNSSLGRTWSSGSYKLPLKLDFDQFEDDHPETEDQRFFGFKRLSLTNNALDPSYLRDKVAGDVFRQGGVPAPRNAFVRVFIDTGDGPTYFGLYTLSEVPGRPMFLSQLGARGGNLYTPEGGAATWRQGLPIDSDSFPKKTNEDEQDWSDVEGAIEALHGSRDDPEAWRASLERRLDVEGFLRWLAINTVIQNWDTYGNMSHNYYLYGDPAEQGRLSWIPWDHNGAFFSRAEDADQDDAADKEGGTSRGPLALDMSGVTDSWPLIRFLIDDPVYEGLYWGFVQEADEGVLNPESMQARFQREHERIAPFVVGDEGELPGYTALADPQAFEASLSDLVEHMHARHQAVTEALARR